jgi:hypothetical protein
LFMTDWFERTNKWVGTFQIMLFFSPKRHFLCQMIGDMSHSFMPGTSLWSAGGVSASQPGR